MTENLFLNEFTEIEKYLPYKILKKLGEGGSRKVYLVRKENINELRKIKIYKMEDIHEKIKEQRSRRELEELIQNECNFLSSAKMRHENLIGYFNHGPYKYTYYMEADYIDGGPIDDFLCKLAKEEINYIFDNILKGVKFLHDKDYVLRDIKLNNILISKDKKLVKIDDLETITTLSELLSKDRDTFGSNKYAAPELLKGEKATKQSDIYSLGACLLYMIKGEVGALSKINKLSQEKYNERLERLISECDKKYRKILFRALSYHPKKRYKSVDKFYKDFYNLKNIWINLLRKVGFILILIIISLIGIYYGIDYYLNKNIIYKNNMIKVKSISSEDIPQKVSLEIKLYEGNNLISFPIIPESLGVHFILESIRGKYNSISTISGNDTMMFYPSDTLTKIKYFDKFSLFKGYWLNMKTDGILRIIGEQKSIKGDVELKKGSNLLAYPYLEEKEIENVFDGVAHLFENNINVSIYDNKKHDWVEYHPQMTDSLKSHITIKPGMAILCYVNDDISFEIINGQYFEQHDTVYVETPIQDPNYERFKKAIEEGKKSKIIMKNEAEQVIKALEEEEKFYQKILDSLLNKKAKEKK